MARDPQRIAKVLNTIRDVWFEFPDLRLGQLLINSTPDGRDLYYIEADEMIKNLREYAKKNSLWD